MLPRSECLKMNKKVWLVESASVYYESNKKRNIPKGPFDVLVSSDIHYCVAFGEGLRLLEKSKCVDEETGVIGLLVVYAGHDGPPEVTILPEGEEVNEEKVVVGTRRIFGPVRLAQQGLVDYHTIRRLEPVNQE